MISRVHSLAVVALLLLMSGSVQARTNSDPEAAADLGADRPWEVIEVAIALDRSGSMEPLVESARSRLWQIVSDLARLEPTPVLRVGLLTYGADLANWKTGYVRIESDLTTDLDQVSERLFESAESGGGEYVGRALQIAVEDLSWTDSEEALKLIFVAGNEPADQDPEVSVRDMVDLAQEKGISVHGIFCGDAESPHAESWKELSELAQTSFAAIDLKAGTGMVETPFDEEMAILSDSISKTYIPLGEEGAKLKHNLIEQDRNAAKRGPSVAADRAQVKTTSVYSSPWDLVGAAEAGRVDLGAVEEDQLPEVLQEMNPEERALYVEEMRVLREDLAQQIAELAAKRSQYAAEQRKTQGVDDSLAFDTVVRQAIRQEAEEKGFHHPASDR